MPAIASKPKPGELKRIAVNVTPAQWRKIERIRKARARASGFVSQADVVRDMIDTYAEGVAGAVGGGADA